MADVSKVKVEGTTYNLKDSYTHDKLIYSVKGTQNASTSAWTGVIDAPALYDGMTIAYYLPYASTSTSVTLNLTLSDNTTTGAIYCYYTGTSRITTHYGAGSVVMLTYYSKGAISVSGTPTGQARWLRCDYNYDSNTWRKVQLNGTDKLGTATSTNPLNIVPGQKINITESSGSFTFGVSDDVTRWSGNINSVTDVFTGVNSNLTIDDFSATRIVSSGTYSGNNFGLINISFHATWAEAKHSTGNIDIGTLKSGYKAPYTSGGPIIGVGYRDNGSGSTRDCLRIMIDPSTNKMTVTPAGSSSTTFANYHRIFVNITYYGGRE